MRRTAAAALSLGFASLAFSPPSFSQTASGSRSFGALQSSRMCRIEVTREGGSQASNLNLGATTKPSVHASHTDSIRRTNVVQSVVVSSGYQATIDVDGEAVQVRCLALPASFELELTVTSRPPAAPAPASLQRPGDASRAQVRPAGEGPVRSLSTTLSVQRGQRTEIGGATRELRNKNRVLSTGGIGYDKVEANGSERVYLIVN